jgi:hypothetical protein
MSVAKTPHPNGHFQTLLLGLPHLLIASVHKQPEAWPSIDEFIARPCFGVPIYVSTSNPRPSDRPGPSHYL